MSAAQQTMLRLVDACRRASAVTEKADLTPKQHAFLANLGETLAYQLEGAINVAEAMLDYARQHDSREGGGA